MIPWMHAPTDTPTPSLPPSPAPRPVDARPCAAAGLGASVDGPNGAGGHELHEVWLRNRSDTTCVLKGYPLVTATETGQPDVVATDGSFFPSGAPANMPPGGKTLLGLETDSYCGAHPDGGGTGPLYHRVEVALPRRGGTLTVPVPDGLDLKCGLRLSPFSVPRPEQPEPPIPLLNVALRLPASVRPGGVLTYVVALTNPTRRSIALAPCPVYYQAASVPVEDVEVLNCAPLHGGLPAHRTARFEMRLRVPADAPAGAMTLKWALLGLAVEGGAQGDVQVG